MRIENNFTQDDIDTGRVIGKWLIIGLLILFGIIALFNCFYIIDAGERGVLLTFGEATMQPMEPGLHFKTPFVQKVVRMSVRTEKYEADAGAASKDMQIVSTKIAVNYRVNSAVVPEIYQELGLGYSEKIIQPAVQEVVKSSTAQFTADELITKRELVKENIENTLKERLATMNIIVEAISITNFDFSPEFNAVIEQKVTAQQSALKAENDLVRIKVEKEQTITRAQAEAESTKAKADAEAYKIVAEADANAYALKVINEQLARSDKLINYKAIEKWNGQVPTYSGNGLIPFMNVQ
jgi:regulator of protease activity HflC (stomatin/prohibitin superfamily)